MVRLVYGQKVLGPTHTVRCFHMMSSLLWWNCRIRHMFVTCYGLVWSTTSGSVSILQHLIYSKGSYSQWESVVTSIQTQVLTVATPMLYHWAKHSQHPGHRSHAQSSRAGQDRVIKINHSFCFSDWDLNDCLLGTLPIRCWHIKFSAYGFQLPGWINIPILIRTTFLVPLKINWNIPKRKEKQLN